jgi:hypothetical protein
MTYLAAKQGDSFSWDSNGSLTSKGQSLKDWRQSLAAIDGLTSTSEDLPKPNHSLLSGIHMWITDLYVDLDFIEQKIKSYSSKHSELMVLHIIGQKEENLDFPSDSSFVDLETNEEIEVDAGKYAATYRQAIGDHFHQSYRLCTQNKAFYQKIYLQDDLPDIIRRLVKQYNLLRAL